MELLQTLQRPRDFPSPARAHSLQKSVKAPFMVSELLLLVSDLGSQVSEYTCLSRFQGDILPYSLTSLMAQKILLIFKFSSFFLL